MFGLQKYLDKLYSIQWNFNKNNLHDIEQILYVKFKPENDYFLLDEILYTYVDILLGLEDIEFEFLKKGNDLILKINKI